MILRFSIIKLCVITLMAFTGSALAQENAAEIKQQDDILCPDVTADSIAVPEDMTGVQADIDRLGLCVQRAELLRKLDEVATKRDEMLQKALNPDNPDGGASASMSNVPIPPLPASALPQVKEIMTSKKDILPAAAPLDGRPTPVKVVGDWTVRKIWGQGPLMRAQLSDGQGTLLNIVKGDMLPSGETVDQISIKGVTISLNGKITDLEWEQKTLTSETSTSDNADETRP